MIPWFLLGAPIAIIIIIIIKDVLAQDNASEYYRSIGSVEAIEVVPERERGARA